MGKKLLEIKIGVDVEDLFKIQEQVEKYLENV